jgi:hypothetical protein
MGKQYNKTIKATRRQKQIKRKKATLKAKLATTRTKKK